MNHKFKYKLQGVLRLKELAEEQIKTNLGRIIREIEEKNQQIENYRNEINFYFDRYELAENSKGDMLGGLRTYMPEFLISHYEKIKKCKDDIYHLDLKKKEIIKKLYEAKGQVKIFSNLKDKKYSEFKKNLNKKINDELDEIVILKGSSNEKN